MVKIHTWHTTTVNNENISYFYKREKNDVNGNPRYRVFIIDWDSIVYETIFKCYDYYIEEKVISFVEGKQK